MANYTLNYTGAGVDSLLRQVENMPDSYLSSGGGALSGSLDIADTLTVGERQYGVNKVLWNGGAYMNASQTATLSEAVSAQPNGIVLVWSWYDGGAKNWDWVHRFIPKHHPNISSGGGVDIFAIDAAGSAGMAKYVYVYDTKIVGNDYNNSGAKTICGLTVNNGNWVLRYVIGV